MDRGTLDDCAARIRTNLEGIQGRIQKAAEKSGRTASAVKLVGVTKLLPLDIVWAGVEAGLNCFGENYPEQALDKIESLKETPGIEWHMIGHIQSRKAEIVARSFDLVHSLDRLKVARLLDRYCGEFGRTLPVLLEVNLSGEGSKSGWAAWDEDQWGALLEPFGQLASLENLEIRGLMSMPPLFEDPESTRPLYRRLRSLQTFLKQSLPDVSWDELSIGTSFDYPVAIEEGATMVRIGTELFGPRPTR